MENITIKLRLVGLVGLLLLITIGIGVFGMTSTHNIIAHLEADIHKQKEITHAVELAETTQSEFKTQIQEWKNILIRGNDAKQYEKYVASFNKRSNTAQQGLGKLNRELTRLGIGTDEVKHVAGLHLNLKSKYDAALKSFDQDNPEAGRIVDRLVKGVDRPVGKAFEAMNNYLSKEIDKIVEQSEEYAAEVESSTRNTDIMLIIMATALGIILALLIIRSIINPLNRVIEIAESLARGDMTVNVDVKGKSEITQLQKAISKMSKKLGDVLTQVRNSADNVSTSANEISDGNLDLSSRTEEQAASIEETASSMEQITEKVKQNSNSAMQAVELANTATEKAEHGLNVANNAVSAISEIKASSEKVADIISVIDEIAFQTNLLALNASIEAERAGEQGRGFSVVANEVQKLAQRSADAANEIKALIKNSTEKVLEGTELVKSSSVSLEEIVKTSAETNDVMNTISSASQEQAAALTQVNIAISQMEQTTQQNAALVEQTSAASTSMSTQAEYLSKLVSFFKLVKEDEGVPHDLDDNMNNPSPTSDRRQNNSSGNNKNEKDKKSNRRRQTTGARDEWDDF